MIRRHHPDLPIDEEGRSGATIIPFPGVQVTPAVPQSTAFDDPDEEWTVCEWCGEDLMVGEECMWCGEGEDD